MEFAEVLEKKIRQEMADASAPPSPRMEIPSLNDELPSGFAWILGQGPVLKANGPVDGQTRKVGHQAYGVKVKPRPPHTLSASQRIAKDLFAALGGSLSESFSRADLKSAWRRVAKSTHPDHGGTNHGFREAQRAHQCLGKVFDSGTAD